MLRNSRGFTLIEMIGALAIISILAAIVVPNLIKKTESVSLQAEQSSLKTFATSLEDYIIRTQSIPSGTSNISLGSWAWSLSNQSEIPLSQIQTNEMGVARQLIIDPAFTLAFSALPLYRPGISPNPAALVPVPAAFYNQRSTGIGGSNAIVSNIPPLRVMIVSDLRKGTGAGVIPLTPLNANGFDDVWNQGAALAATSPWREKNAITVLGGVGATDGDTKTGLVIQRVNLSHLLHRVAMTNYKTQPYPQYLFEDRVAPAALPSPVLVQNIGGNYEFLAMHGSRLTLFTEKVPLEQSNQIFIKGPESFVFKQHSEILPATQPPTFNFRWER